MAVNLCSVVFLTINMSLNTPNFIVLPKSCIWEPVLSACTQVLSESGINAKAVDIQEYVTDTYGQEIRMAARVAVLAAALVMFVVVVLFTRLLVAKDRQDISLRKALGFTGGDIKRLYFLGYLPVLLAGLLAGILFGNLLGEMLAALDCENVADRDNSLLEQLSMEEILLADPEYIFVVLQSADPSDAQAVLETTLLSNPAWSGLTAVREGRYYLMDPNLYNLKPNARWGEAYERLADILYPTR